MNRKGHIKPISISRHLSAPAQMMIKDLPPWAQALNCLVWLLTGVDLRDQKMTL